MRTLTGLFVVAHGLVTAGIWGIRFPAAPEGQVQPPDPAHSWLLGDARIPSMILGILAGVVLALAGFGYLTEQSWWTDAAIGGGAASLLLFAVFFTPWWLAGIAISTALIIGALGSTT